MNEVLKYLLIFSFLMFGLYAYMFVIWRKDQINAKVYKPICRARNCYKDAGPSGYCPDCYSQIKALRRRYK